MFVLHQYAVDSKVQHEKPSFPVAGAYATFAGFPPLKEYIMKSNVGSVDRVVRIVVGLAILSLVFVLEGNARWWGLVGLLPLATGLAGWCAVYRVLGIDTSGAGRATPTMPRPSS